MTPTVQQLLSTFRNESSSVLWWHRTVAASSWHPPSAAASAAIAPILQLHCPARWRLPSREANAKSWKFGTFFLWPVSEWGSMPWNGYVNRKNELAIGKMSIWLFSTIGCRGQLFRQTQEQRASGTLALVVLFPSASKLHPPHLRVEMKRFQPRVNQDTSGDGCQPDLGELGASLNLMLRFS